MYVKIITDFIKYNKDPDKNIEFLKMNIIKKEVCSGRIKNSADFDNLVT